MARWATAAIGDVTEGRLATIDLDQIVRDLRVNDYYAYGVRAFRVVREIVNSAALGLESALILGIGFTESSLVDPPAIDRWNLLPNVPPPQVAIHGPKLRFDDWRDADDYRVLLPTPDAMAGAETYYRLFRTCSDRQKGWEHYHAFYFLDRAELRSEEARH